MCTLSPANVYPLSCKCLPSLLQIGTPSTANDYPLCCFSNAYPLCCKWVLSLQNITFQVVLWHSTANLFYPSFVRPPAFYGQFLVAVQSRFSCTSSPSYRRTLMAASLLGNASVYFLQCPLPFLTSGAQILFWQCCLLGTISCVVTSPI